jgi:Protein of unknown function (DUF3224)
MSIHAVASFSVDSFDEQPWDDADGAKLTRTRITKTFHGDLEATSVGEFLMAHAQAGTAAYSGFERISGKLHGREGSFVLHHDAIQIGESQSGAWTVLPDSATDGLHGLSGNGSISIGPAGDHTFVLDYDLE